MKKEIRFGGSCQHCGKPLITCHGKCRQVKTEQPTGETVFRKVSVKERLPKKSGDYWVWVGKIRDMYYFDVDKFYDDGGTVISVTHWLEEIPLPTQAGPNKVGVDDSFNGNEKMQNHIKEYLKSKGYEANPEKVTQENFNDMLRVALVKGKSLGEISDRCWVICQQAILQALQKSNGRFTNVSHWKPLPTVPQPNQ